MNHYLKRKHTNAEENEDTEDGKHATVHVPWIVSISVAFPELTFAAILIFMSVFTLFALPFFELSNPLTGARIRDYPSALRSDAWITGLLEILPEESNNQRETQQSVEFGSVTLYYIAADDSDNVYTVENIQKMIEIEDALLGVADLESYCLIDLNNNQCSSFVSPLRYLRNATTPAEVKTGLQAMWLDREDGSNPTLFHFDNFFNNETNVKQRIARSRYKLGLPLSGYVNLDDEVEEQRFKQTDYLMNGVEESESIYQTLKKFRDDGYENLGEEMRLTFHSSGMFEAETLIILADDVLYAGASIFTVLVFLYIHTASPFLAIMGLIQILISFPVCYFIYRVVLDIELFGGLNMISVYLLLGIGVDDIFLYTDAVYQSNSLLQGEGWTFEKRLGWASRRAAYTMLTTSVTTGFSFLMLSVSGLPIIRYFGIFTSLLIIVNFILVMTFYTSVLVLWNLYFDKKRICKFQRAGVQDSDEITKDSKAIVDFVPSFGTAFTKENSPDLRKTEKFFRDRFAPVILNRKKRRFILLFFLIVFGTFLGFAAQLEAEREELLFWPEGHFFYDLLTANDDFSVQEGRLNVEGEVVLVWGMDPPFIDRTGTDETLLNDFGSPLFLDPEEFNLATVESQEYLANICSEILDERGDDLFLKPSEDNAREDRASCVMVAFQKWREARNQSFPVPYAEITSVSTEVNGIRVPSYALQESFEDEYVEFLGRPQFGGKFFKASNFDRLGGLGKDMIRIRGITQSFFTTARNQDTYERRVEIIEKWDNLAADINEEQPESLGEETFYTNVIYFVFAKAQFLILLNAFVSLSTSFLIAFGFTTFATGNYIVAGLAMLPIMGVVVTVLGYIYLRGWALGSIESVNIVLVVGISVDYVVHLGVAYAEGAKDRGLQTRHERTQHALVTLGTSVLFGGLTTFLAASFLLFTTIVLSSKFAAIMTITVFSALCWALLVFPSLLAEFGAENHVGDVCVAFHKATKIKYSDDIVVRPPGYNRRVLRRYLSLLLVLFIIAIAMVSVKLQIDEDEETVEGFSDDEYLPSFESLPVNNWEEIRPAGDTVCARGTPYAFFVKRGDPNLPVIIEFEGGGACWNPSTCAVATRTFKDTVEDTRAAFQRIQQNSQQAQGLADERGPYENFTHVYIPYCTGDLHWGNNTVDYSDSLTVRHKGQINAGAAVDWVLDVIPTPTRVLVTGCSAGSYGSWLWGANIAKYYDDIGNGTKVIQVGDSGMGIVSDDFLVESFPTWRVVESQRFPIHVLPAGVNRSNVNISALSLPLLYNYTAVTHPSHVFGQVSSAYDWNQAFFFLTQKLDEGRTIESKDKVEWNVRMRQVYEPFFSNPPPNLYVFLGPGDYHCNVPGNNHYYVETGDTSPFYVTLYKMLVNDTFPADNVIDCLDISAGYCRLGVDLRDDIALI